MVTDLTLLDDVFQSVMVSWTEAGSAPHYTELARSFSVAPSEARGWLHEIFNRGIPGWLFPDTDYIAAMVPLSNIPTQYRVFVDGEPKGYASCGFDAPAVCWLYPGRLVRVEFPCLHCGDDLTTSFLDGALVESDPEGLYFYVDIPTRKWRNNLPFS